MKLMAQLHSITEARFLAEELDKQDPVNKKTHSGNEMLSWLWHLKYIVPLPRTQTKPGGLVKWVVL